ncbi:phage tail spike protein [Symbiobacterium thermophilum]|uniref:phage tail spike protein n=1 Tax=Symbiobacterium thermophilum TaxID=2734 RepID=UPI0023548AF7|nr:phage tail spike protein [Symbiobacterium thermophilum]
MIHITDGRTDQIVSFIDEEQFWDDKHTKSLKDTLETFDFTTFADKRFSEYLAERNRVIIPDEDGEYIEFIIENTRKFHSADGFFVEVYTSASYIELAKAKVIEPQTTPAWTAKQHAEMALSDTEWEIGTVDFAGSRTITIESYTNPYSYLKQVANEFGLELHFRVETDGNKVTRRYVDLVERVGGWNGREVEFGKDLIGIERKEDFSNVVTALVGIGPEREDGTRLQVFVEDKDALARWGRNGKHLIEVYEPESADVNMTLERLRSLTEVELSKRINSVVEYTADVADLEKVPGLEHEKFRFGDTIRIKDTAFTPPLYLEARVHTVERSIKRDGQKTVTLGDYIEYTEEDVTAIWRALRSQILKKISMSDLLNTTYTKAEIDDKDTTVQTVAAQDAANKAAAAETNAKTYAETKAQQAETNAKQAVQNGEVPIPASAILGELELANTILKNANSTVFSDQNGNLYFVDPNNHNLVVKITSNGIAVGKNGVNGSFATAITGNGIIADLITSGGINADLVRIANDRVTIDKNGITVKQADFLVEDPITSVKTSIVKKTNLVQDHSFEMFDADANDNPVDISRYPEDFWFKWKIYGSPKLLSDKYTEVNNSYHPIFGANTAVVNRSNSFEQYIPVKPNRTYTLSAFFRTSMKYNPSGAKPRLHIEFFDANDNSIGGASQDFPATPANNPVVVRYAKTFTTPSNARSVRILPMSVDYNTWIEVDGVQLVEGDKPVTYDPEDKLWQMRTRFREKFYSVYSPVFNSVAVQYLGLDDKTISQANGFLVLRSLNDRIYLQSPIEIRAVKPYTTADYIPILASAFRNQSQRESKKNIEPFNDSVVEKIKNTQVYTFHFNYEEDDAKKHLGLMVEEAPEHIVSGDSIDLYAMNSYLWRCIQELIQRIEKLEATLATEA